MLVSDNSINSDDFQMFISPLTITLNIRKINIDT